MSRREVASVRLKRSSSPTLWNYKKLPQKIVNAMQSEVSLSVGWGKLIFAHTFQNNERLVQAICQEGKNERNLAFYMRDPHVLLSIAPQELFLDPSHAYRLWFSEYQPALPLQSGFLIRRLQTKKNAEEVIRIYQSRHMVTPSKEFLEKSRKSKTFTYLIAEDRKSRKVVGTITGIDHKYAFDDPENGSSFWCLAVDSQAPYPGVGLILVRSLIEHYIARGRAFIDLSVMHNNKEAIALYEKMGFRRVPVFCIKHKNPFNEPLFVSAQPSKKLNPYAKIIVEEALRRGIEVEVLDENNGYFQLTFGGRSIVCRESLSEFTTAIAMSRCQDKQVTHLVLRGAGLSVPIFQEAGNKKVNEAFLKEHKRIVIKPAEGEQGEGVIVDVQKITELNKAIEKALQNNTKVILEKYYSGQDLRIVVIDFKVVAAAERKPPRIIGTGKHTITQLLRKQNRRRLAATGGESQIPLDDETARCIRQAGYKFDDSLPANEELIVRKTANLHTGGTIHDVTDSLHPYLRAVAEKAARALGIPVVGLDFIVPRIHGQEYVIIEANERVGLANHEPQPTAQRFIDMLFPLTASNNKEP